MQREKIDKEVVGDGLKVTVERVESMGCKRSRDDPFVVWLVKALVDCRPMQPSMDKVDA